MTAPQAQADSQPRKPVFILDLTPLDLAEAGLAASREDADLLTELDREASSAQPCQIKNTDALDKILQGFGSRKYRLQDHAEWSAYLDSRYILEAAVAAGAWVEYNDHYRRNCLVWHEKRRDGSRGARRRRFIDPPVIEGEKIGKSIWFKNEKTDEPFHYIGTWDDLKRAISAAGAELNIVEGEVDVWSMHSIGLPNTIGLYGARIIPPDIASILDELGAKKVILFADNDRAGRGGAAKLRAFLHESGWTGEVEYRQFKGPGIPEKGDANDLLCHHYPDLAATRAALDALPRFVPGIEPKRAPKPFTEVDYHDDRWAPVKEAVRIALGVTHFKANGFSKNIGCPNPHHEDSNPSATLHKDGFCTCQVCGTFNAKQLAEFLGIDWRSLLRPQPKLVSTADIDLNAAPAPNVETAPLAFDQAPDSWLRLLRKFYKPIEAVLFLYVSRAHKSDVLAEQFTRQELLKALPLLGCNVDKGAIYKVFQELSEHDNHPLFVKADPSLGSGSRYCKFSLRSPAECKRRLAHDIRLRVYEDKFAEHTDILIGFEVFDEALPGSEFTKTLKTALEPLYREQKQRFDSLINACEGLIAGYVTGLDDLSATPLPDWTIDKPSELPALLARGIYDKEPEDRGKAKWAPELGISISSVDTTLQRAGIKRTAYTIEEEVDSQREAKDRAREHGAKIVGVKVDGGYLPYDAAMDISPGTVLILQPPAKHEIVSDEKQIIKAPAKPGPDTAANSKTERAGNMRKPGNWHEPRWDPQFIYWELLKACCLLHGYEVRDDVGIYDPRTGEVWTNPTLDEVVQLIIEESDAAEPDTG